MNSNPFESIENTQKSSSFQKDLEQLLAYTLSKGLRFTLISGESSQLEAFIPALGELVWLKDQGALVLGEGESPLSQCRDRLSVYQVFDTLKTLESQVKEVWHRLNQRSALGSVKEYIFPPLWAQEFIRQKPQNFVFLQGETLPSSSPFVQWGSQKKALEGKGFFFRVWDGSQSLGQTQASSVGRHEHKLEGRYLIKPRLVMAQQEEMSGVQMVSSLEYLQESCLEVFGQSETRPAGLWVIAVQKVAY